MLQKEGIVCIDNVSVVGKPFVKVATKMPIRAIKLASYRNPTNISLLKKHFDDTFEMDISLSIRGSALISVKRNYSA